MENKLGQEPAFSQSLANDNNGSIYSSNDKSHIDAGMSKRFYAACAAMQGLLAGEHRALTCVKSGSHTNYGGYDYTYNFQKLIENSYKLSDELLKQEYE